MALTLEQKKAIALASARKRLQDPARTNPPVVEALNPTEGNNFFQNLSVGAGKALVDTGRGLKQLFNIGDQDALQEDIDLAKERDEAIMRTGGGITGNVATHIGMALAPGGAVKTASKLPQLAAHAPKLNALAQALLAPKSIIGAGTAGAAYAGVQPTASDESTAGNMGLGFAGGAAIPAALKALPAAKAVGGYAAKPFKLVSSALEKPKIKAQNKLVEALRRDIVTPEKAAATMRKMGPQSTLADAAGENVLGLADVVVQTPGRTRNQAIAMLTKRQAGQQGRVMDTLIDNVGDEKSFYQALDGINESLKTKSSPLYKEAFQANQDMSSELIDKILKTPAGKKAFSGARERIGNQMAMMGRRDLELSEQARFLASIDSMESIPDGVSKGLKLRTLDYIKQEMDDIIGSTEKMVRTGNARQGELRDLVSLRKRFVNELDNLDITAQAGPNSLKPEGGAYARARALYAGDARNRQSLISGRKFLKEDAEITEKMLTNMSASEKEYFRAGAMRAIREKIESASDTADAYKRIFNNKTVREKLRSVFPDNHSFAKFARQMQTESKFYQTRAAVTGNSATARRLAQQSDVGIDPELMSGAVLSPKYAAARSLVRALQKRSGLPEPVIDELGQALFTQDPAAKQQIIAELLKRQPSARPSVTNPMIEALRYATPVAIGSNQALNIQ